MMMVLQNMKFNNPLIKSMSSYYLILLHLELKKKLPGISAALVSDFGINV
ncbi:MAG: hypothetical protein CM15mV51_1170 [uncultured marine virus]|nr:MAG: hypothetical protein CM15mV51_1170 [uncultured marine virus]